VSDAVYDYDNEEWYEEPVYPSHMEQGSTYAQDYYAEPDAECYVCGADIWEGDTGIEVELVTHRGDQGTVVVCSDECRTRLEVDAAEIRRAVERFNP